jgi:Anthrone oxygenase
MFFGELALAAAALFTGAAFYINFAEQPARLLLDDRSLLVEWKPAYKRGFIMQSSLAVIAFVLGAVAWWLSGRPAFLVGGLLMLGNWPWTIFAILPTNNALMATDPERVGSDARELIIKWNALHAVRTGLGALAVVAFLFALW